ncbi:MAG: DMT family protein [Candidatus Acidiferrales bacterium]|jgi:uncharacterized protein
MKTILALCVSNTFMTFAWYGHLKYPKLPMKWAILLSWLIALGEYCFQVPANRWGYGEFTAYHLKIVQEVITLPRRLAHSQIKLAVSSRAKREPLRRSCQAR